MAHRRSITGTAARSSACTQFLTICKPLKFLSAHCSRCTANFSSFALKHNCYAPNWAQGTSFYSNFWLLITKHHYFTYGLMCHPTGSLRHWINSSSKVQQMDRNGPSEFFYRPHGAHAQGLFSEDGAKYMHLSDFISSALNLSALHASSGWFTKLLYSYPLPFSHFSLNLSNT